MPTDTERAALVSQEFRYDIRKDASTLALYPNSQAIELDTNLDAAGASALANDIFTVSGVSARTFTVTIEALLLPDDFLDGAPRFKALFDRHPAADPSKTYTVIAAKADILAGTTSVTVRG